MKGNEVSTSASPERYIRQLEDENAKLRDEIAHVGSAGELEIKSVLNAQLKGSVTLRLGSEFGTCSPNEARNYAFELLQAAEEIESDMRILKILRESGIEIEVALNIVYLTREDRKLNAKVRV